MLAEIITEVRKNDSLVKEISFENETIIEADLSKIEFESVQFKKCRFVSCNFTGSEFSRVIFDNCDVSNCLFRNSYWKASVINDSKCDGGNFNQTVFKDTQLMESAFHYSNCVSTVWDHCAITGCDFGEAFLSEVKFKKIQLSKVNFTSVDFFKTPLKGIDFSDCTIDGIMVSDSHAELRGAKVNMFQAVAIAKILGVKVV